MNLNLKKPCKNCPFRVVGAIELREGRLKSIALELLRDDRTPFVCHKTAYGKNADGTVETDEDGEERYVPGKKDSACPGAMAFLLKLKQPNVAMRMGAGLKLLKYEDLEALFDEIVEPSEVLG